MRFWNGCLCALALLSVTPTEQAAAYDVLATVFQTAPTSGTDPDPTIEGVVRIDSTTGATTPFFADPATNIFALSDVAVGPHDGLVYVANLGGAIERFNSAGVSQGFFTFFPDDGVNRLRFLDDGTLFVSTSGGVVAEFDPNGTRQTDLATGLTFPTGIAVNPAGDVFVATGDVGGPGGVVRITGTGTESVSLTEGIGGGSGLTFVPSPGDFNNDATANTADYDAWAAAYGSSDSAPDANGDGTVDAADYTDWRDSEGQNAKLLISDFGFGLTPTEPGNRLLTHDLFEAETDVLTTIPVPLPDPLPNPPTAFPSNFPTEILFSPEGTLLVSTTGPAQRPINYATLLEFDTDGTFLRRITPVDLDGGGLPQLSGIALLPATTGTTVPEPAAAMLACFAMALAWRQRR